MNVRDYREWTGIIQGLHEAPVSSGFHQNCDDTEALHDLATP